VIQDPVEPKLIFAGAENGLWVSLNDGKTWNRWTSGYPAGLPTMDMVIHPREHDLVIGSFGRGVYVLDDVRPLRELVKDGVSVLEKKLHVFDPGTAYIIEMQSATGVLFPGNGMFTGPNRAAGAQLTYVINKPKDEKKDEKADETKTEKKPTGKSKKKMPDESQVAPIKKDTASVKADSLKKDPAVTKYDSIKVEVFNNAGAKIRTIVQKTPEDNGVNRFVWSLTEKGERYPAREKSKSTTEPSGVTVLPGTYKLRFTFGDQKDSTMVEVKSDPRYQTPADVIAARYKMLKDLQAMVGRASAATDRLRESKEVLDEYEKKLKDSKDESHKKALTQTKAMKDSINAVFDFILGKEDKRQGITSTKDPEPMSYVSSASFYIGSSIDPVNETDRRVFELAEQKVKEILDRVNKFYETQWKQYRGDIEKLTISPFKDYQPLELK